MIKIRIKKIKNLPEIIKIDIFRPPKKPPESEKKTPKMALFWPPRNPQNCHFWPLFGPQIWPPKCQFLTKIPKTTLFRPPPDSKNPGKWPFWRKPGFSSKIWTAKRGGGVGVYPGTPQKGHFWPFLTIFGDFWPFLTPFLGCPRPPKNPPLRMWIPPKTPLAARTISNNRVIRPQIWNLRRKRGFFCTPTGAGNVSESGRNYPYYYC